MNVIIEPPFSARSASWEGFGAYLHSIRFLIHVSVTVLLLTGVSIAWIDRPAVSFFRSLGGDRQVWFSIVSDLANGRIVFPLLGISLVASLVLRQNPLLWRRVTYVIAVVVISGLLNTTLKVLFGRYRPQLFFSDDLYGFGFFETAHLCLSFPSGHANMIGALCLSLAFIWPKHTLLLLLPALVIGFTRVLICTHYPSDILAGVYLALVTAFVLKKWCDSRAILGFPSHS